jgi:hypothetical protein
MGIYISIKTDKLSGKQVPDVTIQGDDARRSVIPCHDGRDQFG